MQRPIITIPRGLLRQLSYDWDIDWRGQSAGETNTGITPTLYNRFPRWVGEPQVLLQGSGIAQWRAIRAQAQGALGMYRLQLCDPVGFADPNYSASIPYASGQVHSSGQGFAYVPTCTAKKNASAGDTEIRVTSDIAPSIGQIMGHGLWPFMVTSVTPVSGSNYDLGIQMPLRADITKDDTILMQGEGLFEAVEEGMGNPAYGASRSTTVQLRFREVLNR